MPWCVECRQAMLYVCKKSSDNYQMLDRICLTKFSFDSANDFVRTDILPTDAASVVQYITKSGSATPVPECVNTFTLKMINDKMNKEQARNLTTIIYGFLKECANEYNIADNIMMKHSNAAKMHRLGLKETINCGAQFMETHNFSLYKKPKSEGKDGEVNIKFIPQNGKLFDQIKF